MKLNHYIRISLVSLGVIFANIACISPLKAASFQGLGDLPTEELAGVGPEPFLRMLLSSWGSIATILGVERFTGHN